MGQAGGPAPRPGRRRLTRAVVGHPARSAPTNRHTMAFRTPPAPRAGGERAPPRSPELIEGVPPGALAPISTIEAPGAGLDHRPRRRAWRTTASMARAVLLHPDVTREVEQVDQLGRLVVQLGLARARGHRRFVEDGQRPPPRGPTPRPGTGPEEDAHEGAGPLTRTRPGPGPVPLGIHGGRRAHRRIGAPHPESRAQGPPRLAIEPGDEPVEISGPASAGETTGRAGAPWPGATRRGPPPGTSQHEAHGRHRSPPRESEHPPTPPAPSSQETTAKTRQAPRGLMERERHRCRIAHPR